MRYRLGVLCVVTAGVVALLGVLQSTDVYWLISVGVASLLLFAGVSLRLGQAGMAERWIRQVAAFMLVAFVALFLHLLRYEVVDLRAALAGSPNSRLLGDPRIELREERTYRGQLLDRRGVWLARSVERDGVMLRQYSQNKWGNLLGYYSPRVLGKSGLELSLDEFLSGKRGRDLIGLLYALSGKDTPGNDVWLTIDARLQQRADDLLAGRPGAVVVMEAGTGALLAAASSPDFAPGDLSDDFSVERPEDATRVMASWQRLSGRTDAPLLNRALQGLYTPGSVFKTVTLAAALSSGRFQLDSGFTDTGSLQVDGHLIRDPNRPDPSRQRYTLEDGYIWSLNSVFAQVALSLGPDQLQQTTSNLGFGSVLMDDFPAAVSQLYSTPGFLNSRPALADTGYGQGEIWASPLQMAVVAAVVANNGTMPRPYLLEKVVTPWGVTTYVHKVQQRPVLDSQVAQQVKQAMVASVRSGWARPAALHGVQVAGKTGTAENPHGAPHAWFVGFAPADNPRYVVAVVLENGGDGVSIALPVGRELLWYALTLR